MTDSMSRVWFSIEGASRLLDVPVRTVREWADSGILPSYRTPSGHRRFTASDLRDFINQKQHRSQPQNAPALTQKAQRADRQGFRYHPRSLALRFKQCISPDPQKRAGQSEFNQIVLHFVVSYVERPDQREYLVDTSRSIACEYGRALASSHASVGDAARAMIYLRELILKAALDAHIGRGDEEDAHLFQRVSNFLDEILLAIVDSFPLDSVSQITVPSV